MSELRKIIIDGVEIEAHPDLAVIQACELADIEIPRFCYHERLSIAGNCRMCLVEPVGAPKPAASCHLQVKDLRGGRNGEPPEVRTNSPMVKKAREGVMEFLLINHPLDCPICDQGGECDLQDQAMAYGLDDSRFQEHKRAMNETNLGALIKTHMTRCIQCTRCVRFVTEIAGVPEMGCTGRGEDAEIVSYLDQALTSELQGNVIDLCPVGALTSRPYAFTARPWELKKTESIDVMDALGANIRIDSRGSEVMRILPREHADLNEEWLDDKQRFIWDGLRRQRLDQPYIRGAGGRLRPAGWTEAFGVIATRLKGMSGDQIGAVAGDLAPVEAMWALKGLMTALGSSHMDCRQDGCVAPVDAPSAWLFNPGVAAIDHADRILLVGADPRRASPVLNARIRKAWLQGADVYRLGAPRALTYEVTELGDAPQEGLAEAERRLSGAERPLIIVGEDAATHAEGRAIIDACMAMAERLGAVRQGEDQDGWVGYAMLHHAAARVGGLEIGFAPDVASGGRDFTGILKGAFSGALGAVYLLGADEFDMDRLGSAFVIYQGSHGDAGAQRADVILPGAAYTEEPGLFVNMEGRPQLALRATFPPGEARDNWAVLRALSEHLGCKLPYDNLEALRADLFAAHGGLGDRIGEFTPRPWARMSPEHGSSAGVTNAPMATQASDFHLSNPIARASETMAVLSRMASARKTAQAAE